MAAIANPSKFKSTTDDGLQIHEVRPGQATIALGVTGQNQHLESLRCLV